MSEDIEKLRARIDALDDELVSLVQKRARLAQEIGGLKGGAPAYRPEREAQVLRRIAAQAQAPLSAAALGAIFREVISACRGLEQAIRVAYLGPAGTFSEQAVRRHFGAAVEAESLPSVDEVFRRCESGEAQFAVVPVENSTEGVVGRTLDLLLVTPLKICGEVELRVQQNLMAKQGDAAAVKRVYSHAQSLAQCNAWLNRHLPGAERVPVASNAEAAERASREPGTGAIAGEAAAARFGLQLLARGIEDDPNNTTRFLVLGALEAVPSGRDRTSLVLSVENRPGAVHALLTPIAEAGVSMTRIESRPARAMRSALWEYVFYIDLEGHQREAAVAAAIEALRRKAPFLKVLGSYPAAGDR
ncbi:MAG TPA: prephenate dehydratase [Burkholderiales bacterium]|nr:prephenate dehydratase [Burkholderiales bacterium]